MPLNADPLLQFRPLLHVAARGFAPEHIEWMRQWWREGAEQTDLAVLMPVLQSDQAADVLLLLHGGLERDSDASVVKIHFWKDAEQALAQVDQEAMRARYSEVLEELENKFLPQYCRFVIAQQMIQRYLQKERQGGLWHVQAGGVLLAVVDYEQAMVAIRPGAHYLELSEADWSQRSMMALAPASFASVTFEHLTWNFARYSEQIVLPAEYFFNRIALLRPPRIGVVHLHQHDMAVIDLLRGKTQTFQEICENLSLAKAECLAIMRALHFNRCVSVKRLSWWRKLLGSPKNDAKPHFDPTTSVPLSQLVPLDLPGYDKKP